MSLVDKLSPDVLFNRLPPDVLSIIFHLVPDSPWIWEQKEHGDLEFQWAYPVWSPCYVKPGSCVRLSHVCHLWRELTLSLPTLWSNVIDSYSVSVPVDVMVRRSQTAPLDIYLKDSPQGYLKNLLSSGDSKRIRSVWLEARFDAPAEELLAPLAAPGVESVVVMSHQYFYTHKPLRSILLFGGRTPRITQLVLSNTYWLPANNMPSLTQLQIGNIICSGFYLEILSVLERTPNLIDLILTDIRCPEHSPPEPRAIRLPKLAMIRLGGDHEYNSGLGNILSCLSVADTTALRMGESCCQLPHLPVIQAITKISVLRENFGYTLVATGPLSGIYVYSDRPDHDDLFMLMIRRLPLVQIWESWVIERIALNYATFTSLLPWMPRLEKLVVLAESVEDVVGILLEPSDPSQAPLSRSGMTVHIIMQDSDVNIAVLIGLIVRQKEVNVAHLIIGYHRTYDGPQIERSCLAKEFQLVEFTNHEEFPYMDLPPVCTESAHDDWRSWFEAWDGFDAPSTMGNA
ncbi:hypothetical protein SCP_0805380 [Sparassis crispa]|uniref:Uncharacterized protein n=1 Tax=Sparassis crispa TaxID=139825 RepID=A0A401GW71_9APHY|nr:hypothetical protein SCP_0805380 [Sparassis crispa]GBE86014.1 hypothetical protein SCP_0805380 [Sparassis crispa]